MSAAGEILFDLELAASARRSAANWLTGVREFPTSPEPFATEVRKNIDSARWAIGRARKSPKVRLPS